MTHLASLVVVFKTLSLLMGGLVTYYAYRAYQRTGAPALRALAIGFGVVTLGALAAGLVDQALALDDRSLALLVESVLSAVGFGVILYSLHVE